METKNTPAKLRKHIDAIIAKRDKIAMINPNDERVEELTSIIEDYEDIYIDAVNKQNASK